VKKSVEENSDNMNRLLPEEISKDKQNKMSDQGK
jgi:hypothetical protein